jgi:prophage regulatory protein
VFCAVVESVPVKQKAPSTANIAARFDFPRTGLVRLKSILAPEGPIPVGKTTWWQGVRSGRFPRPTKLSSKITCWRAEDIHDLITKAFGPTSDVVEQPDDALASRTTPRDVGVAGYVGVGRGGSDR